MTKNLVPDAARAQYLAADTGQGRLLARWRSQQSDGPYADLLALLHMQCAIAAEKQQATLVKELASAIVATSKAATQDSLLRGELWDKAARRRFENDLSQALMEVLQAEVPDGWEDILSSVADRFHEISERATTQAKLDAPKRAVLK